MLKRVVGAEAYSFLDGFSGHNQLSIALKDQHKMAFAMERGTFAYGVMPFGLTNAPSTFQRLMCHMFKDFLKSFWRFMLMTCAFILDREWITCLNSKLSLISANCIDFA